MQGSALATGAAAMESLLLQWSENRGGLCSGCVEVQSAKSECAAAVAVGEQAEVADLDEARGQDVKQEAAVGRFAESARRAGCRRHTRRALPTQGCPSG